MKIKLAIYPFIRQTVIEFGYQERLYDDHYASHITPFSMYSLFVEEHSRMTKVCG